MHVMSSSGELWCGRKVTDNTLVADVSRGTPPLLECVCLRCALRIGKPYYDDWDIMMEGSRRRKKKEVS
jgi:hypothetical protein